LRRGWTTGACAAAAARAAGQALLSGGFPDPVTIRLPRGEQPSFALVLKKIGNGTARAGVVKDAGDDPDVTHGALVIAEVAHGAAGSGITFHAGAGVGRVTLPGLPLAVGEPAINPGPRAMIRQALADAAESCGTALPDLAVTIAIPGGEALAQKTLNGRLGIVGGLSVLGTTGIVIPYSCSSWIHSIHRGIDVARAAGRAHIAAATGATSEAAVRRLYGLPEIALIDMGDFVGGMLKFLREARARSSRSPFGREPRRRRRPCRGACRAWLFRGSGRRGAPSTQRRRGACARRAERRSACDPHRPRGAHRRAGNARRRHRGRCGDFRPLGRAHRPCGTLSACPIS
jgi:cobalamin biosynthesis protein CbiD